MKKSIYMVRGAVTRSAEFKERISHRISRSAVFIKANGHCVKLLLARFAHFEVAEYVGSVNWGVSLHFS